MSDKKIITPGDRFGRWTAMDKTETREYPSGAKIHFLECRCDCGAVQMVSEYKLRIGHSRSCGCLQAEVTTKRSLKHGYSPKNKKRPRIYSIWCNIISRCTNPNLPSFEDYGARGITVCDRWLNSFENFLADMGEPPDGLTIDRLNNDGNYEPENCAWRTPLQQARNRRSGIKLTFRGETLLLVEWAERLGVQYRTLRGRYERGWSAERIITEPFIFGPIRKI